MNSSTEELVYQPQGPSKTDAFVAFCVPGMANKWRKDKSIPLVDVVARFDIYVRYGDVKGTPNKPSRQNLHAAFGTSNIEEVLKIMLEKGTIHLVSSFSAS